MRPARGCTSTLRLLFADHDHRPYFVFSPELRITVTSPFTVRLAVDGLGVASKGHGGPGLGYFLLDVLAGDGRVVKA